MRKLTLACIGCAASLALPIGAQASPDIQKLSQDDAQWVMPAKNYAGTRFSGLKQINTANVKDLQVAWTFSTGVLQGHEAAPLVVGNTMYIVTPWPNILYALDLTDDGSIKWVYKPGTARAAQGVACCDVVNRGPAYAEGKIFYNTLDNHTVAIEADSGQEVWNTKLGEINKGETMTMAPLVVKDKVLVGNSGGEMGVRGWITALDLDTGKIAWRAYHTGPDKDILIGKDFKDPYPGEGKNLGETTWPSEAAWQIGGGTVWGWITYDPKADLIYYGTSNPGPWNAEQRPGDNKWTSSAFARDPDTGQAKWAYQWSPHDAQDYDGINENMLLDLKIDGKMRKVLVQPSRNGFMYVMDRMTGKVISAEPFVPTNAFKRIDLKTGKPVYNKEKIPTVGKVTKDICPAPPGGKDWQPMAYSPRTGYLYVPSNNLCFDEEYADVGYIAGTPYVGAEVSMHAGPGGHRGIFQAWDPVKNQRVWQIKEKFPAWSGAVATAGDVVFYGTMDRWFKAVDAKTGKLLWKFRMPSSVNGQPITFEADGKQYVAVLTGVGGWSGAVVSGGLDTTIPYGALGFVNAMTDLGDYTAEGGTLMVFALPDSDRGQQAKAELASHEQAMK
jgi:lanthanide-dependent methanol dehydrogenase